MALISRNDLSSLVREAASEEIQQVYLFFGERYLCKESADQLQKALCDSGKGTVNTIDGEAEDPGQTLARLMSFSLLPGRQIFRVNDSRLFLSKKVSSSLWDKALIAFQSDKKAQALRHLRTLADLALLEVEQGDRLSDISKERWKELFGFERPTGDLSWGDELLIQAGPKKTRTTQADIGEKYISSLKQPPPKTNILLLCAEHVDKRRKLFKYIKKNGVIVDCSVAAGSTAKAQKEQQGVLRGLVKKSLDGLGKTIEGPALELLFERVGFHPVAAVMESEKLALYVGDKKQISRDDVERMVCRSREDALFELTDAFGKRDRGKTLVILGRLLDNGIHSLAIIATMRNYLKKLLVIRSLQHMANPAYHRGISAGQFQKQYLPALKKSCSQPELLSGHPYALYMNFNKAAELSCTLLKMWLILLLGAEFRLKGSPLDQKLVLEELFVDLFKRWAHEDRY